MIIALMLAILSHYIILMIINVIVFPIQSDRLIKVIMFVIEYRVSFIINQSKTRPLYNIVARNRKFTSICILTD